MKMYHTYTFIATTSKLLSKLLKLNSSTV